MPEKRFKAAVDYSLGGDHCGACVHFIEAAENEASETGKCELVEGDIGEDMWCKLFARKRKGGYKAGMARHVRRKT
jgi:hypothetical protein